MTVKAFFCGAGLCCLLFVSIGHYSQKPEAQKVKAKESGRLSAHINEHPQFYERITTQKEDIEVVALKNALKKTPQALNVLVQLGHALFDRKHYAQAIDIYHQVLKQQPNNAVVLTDMGSAYFYLGMPHLALEKYQQAIQVAPEIADAYLNAGFAYISLEKKSRAKWVWQKILTLDIDESFKQKVLTLLKELESSPSK